MLSPSKHSWPIPVAQARCLSLTALTKLNSTPWNAAGTRRGAHWTRFLTANVINIIDTWNTCRVICSIMPFDLFSVTHCDAPPESPTGDMEPADWDGSPIEFDTNITYRCKRGMKVADDFEGINDLPQATCREGNIWEFPASMPTCITSM